MPPSRVEFSTSDDDHLIAYLAVYAPDGRNRSGNVLYKRLEANADGLWPWAARHPPQSWRERYKKRSKEFDRAIRKYQKTHKISSSSNPPSSRAAAKSTRVEFTKEDDLNLVQYLAQHSLVPAGRKGNVLYEDLCADPDKWPWSTRHPWSSWRERYKGNSDEYDAFIKKIQNASASRHSESSTQKHPRTKASKAQKRATTSKEEVTGGDSETEEDGVDGEKEERLPAVKEEEEEESQPREKTIEEVRPDLKGKGKQRETRAGSEVREKRRRDEPVDQEERVSKRKRRRVEQDDNAELAAGTVGNEETGAQEEEEDEQGSDPEANNKNVVIAEPLGDYAGEIFDKDDGDKSEDDDHQTIILLSETGKLSEEEEEEEEEESHEGSLPPENNGESGVLPSTPEPADHTYHRIYPRVPQSPAAEIDLSFSNSLPEERALEDPALPLESPKQSVRQPVIKIAQAPTPPTSVPAQSALPSPVAAAPRPINPIHEEPPQNATVEPAAAATSHPARLPRASKFRIREVDDSDFFASIPPTPSPASSSRRTSPVEPMRRRVPPRIQEGAFNTMFTDSPSKRRSAGKARPTGVGTEDEDASDSGIVADSNWPPTRSRFKGKEKETIAPAHRTAVLPKVRTLKQEARHYDPVAPHAFPAGSSAADAEVHHAFSQATGFQDIPVPATRPKPAVQIEDHHAFSQPSIPMPGGIDRLTAALNAALSSTNPAIRQPVPPSKLALLNEVLNKEVCPSVPVDQEDGELVEETPEPAVSVPIQVFAHEDASDGTASPRSLPHATSSTHSDPEPNTRHVAAGEVSAKSSDRGVSYLSDSSHTASKVKERMSLPVLEELQRRRVSRSRAIADDFDHYNPQAESTIRMQQSLPPFLTDGEGTDDGFDPRRVRSDGGLGNVDIPYPSPNDAILSKEDSAILKNLALQRMAENHGFNVDIVDRVWREVDTVTIADKVLAAMRDAANRAADELLAVYRARERERVSEALHIPTSSRARRAGSASRSSHSRTSSSFRFVPLPAQNSANGSVAEYSPPKHTRAGQWNRLAKQGREQEANAREISRVIGSAVLESPSKSSESADYDDGSHGQVESMLGYGRQADFDADDTG